MTDRGDLARMLADRKAVVCVGCGGVGKTTLAAALALFAAQSGLRTLCLTIDPARRLASSLGLSSFPHEEAVVSPEWLRSHGIELSADLTVMMLDTKLTFDELVRRFAPSPAVADGILANRVYRHLSQNLAGTQAYMAMEKLLAVSQDERFDLVVLDTPPSSRAIEFFDAPRRMVDVLDSPATRALVAAMGQGKGMRLNLVARGMRSIIHTLGRVTGTSLLEELAGLLASMRELFGGFESRAQAVSAALRSSDFAYLLVTSPSPPAVADAHELAGAMGDRALPISAVLVNRLTPEVGELPSRRELSESAAYRSLDLDEACVDRVLLAAREAARHRSSEEGRLSPLREEYKHLPRVMIPSFAEDIHRPDRLLALGRTIANG